MGFEAGGDMLRTLQLEMRRFALTAFSDKAAARCESAADNGVAQQWHCTGVFRRAFPALAGRGRLRGAVLKLKGPLCRDGTACRTARPVSGPNSLISGKITGNFAEKGRNGRHLVAIKARQSRRSEPFPYAKYQGKFGGITGNGRPISGKKPSRALLSRRTRWSTRAD
jgi:hypothetical protein